jgi:hypothetical protein
MEGHLPTSQAVPQNATSGLSENAVATPQTGKPGDVNGPVTTPQVERGVNGLGVGGTSSLPLQGQVPAYVTSCSSRSWHHS